MTMPYSLSLRGSLRRLRQSYHAIDCRFLGKENHKPEAIALVKANLSKYIEGDQYFLKNLLASYVPMVSIAGKPEDVTSVLLPALAAHPDIIDNERIGKNLVQYLLKEPGHEEEALSYGKLYWMVCDFDASLLNSATALLQKAWMAVDMDPITIGPVPDAKDSSPTGKVLLGANSVALPDAVHLELPAQTATPDVVATRPFGTPGTAMPETVKVLLPSANQTQPDVSPVNTRTLILAGYAAQWRAGNLTLEDLFKNASFTAQDALTMLSAPGVLTSWKTDMPLRQALMNWLMEHSPQSLEPSEKLPLPTQVALAEYYGNQRDTRAEKIYQYLLTQKFPAGVWWHKILVMNCLAEYYGDRGEFVKAAEAKLQIGQQTADETWISNTQVEAARYYIQAGMPKKATPLYKKAEKSTYGWAAGMALWDQARVLVLEKKYEDARKLLSSPVTGQYSDQIKIAMLSLLSQTYYFTSDFEMASRYAQQAIEQANTVTLLKNEGIESQINIAETIVRLSKQWKRQPIFCVSSNLSITAPAGKKQPLNRWLLIQTQNSVPINTEVNNPNIQIFIEKQTIKGGYFTEKRIRVEINPNGLHQNIDATLVVSSPAISGSKLQIPIHITLEKPVHISEDSVFFGVVKLDTPVKQMLTLSSSLAYHILSVTSDSPIVTAQLKDDGGDYEIWLTYTPTEPDKITNGELRIETDLPEQKIITVSYVGYCEN